MYTYFLYTNSALTCAICFNPMGRDHRKLHESLGKTVSAELERRFASHPNVAQQGKRAEI